MKNVLLYLLGCLSAVALASPRKPFPQNEFSTTVTLNEKRSVAETNTVVAAFYDAWKSQYIRKTKNTLGGYILATGGGTNAEEKAITVSEGHGYGMVVTALMAGHDRDAQKIFDGFYKVFRAYPSEVDPDLMTWQILGEVGKYEKKKLAASATDGDFDIAYALILADRQWGSKGDINYLAEAKKVINAIGRREIHPELKRILLGDWVGPGQKWSLGTRSSDWVPSHFRLFGEVSCDSLWYEVVDTTYSILFAVQNDSTGLVPDFVDSVNPVPAAPKFLETERDGHFSSNACRVPWRIAMDLYHYKSKRGREALLPLLNWIATESDGDLAKMDNGYSLEGKPDWVVDSWGTWGAYSAPMMVAAAGDSSFSALAESGWEHNSQFHSESGYYSNSLRLLSLLTVSGNWWNPSENDK